MIDINLIRSEPEKIREGLKRRGRGTDALDELIKVDACWRKVSAELDNLRAAQNVASKKMAASAGKAGNEKVIEAARENKKAIEKLENEKAELETQRSSLLVEIPNTPFPDVPFGRDERENKTLREVGEKRKFDFEPADYLTLAEGLGIINVKKSAEVSGSRFGYILGDAVLLEFALVQLAFRALARHGFTLAVPPVMIKPKVYQGMGRLSADQKDERYYLQNDDLYLVGSSEHTMGPFHLNEILDAGVLPRRYAAFSSCFRREAGSHGKDTKGILRVHQFDKVEMFSFTLPEKSEEEHRFLLARQEELMAALRLPYRVVEICAGDMGATDARQFDLEAWLPGQTSEDGKSKGRYRETHSCSNTTDYQARGINARYRTKEGAVRFLHMLNATAFPIGRLLIAIIENYQTKSGGVEVPEVLREYVGKKEILPPTKT